MDDEYYASSAILSIYFPTDKNGKIESGRYVDENEFLRNTYLTISFRGKTHLPLDKNKKHYISYFKIFRLSNEEDFKQEKPLQFFLEDNNKLFKREDFQ